MKSYASDLMFRIREHFEVLYGTGARTCMERLDMIIGRYGIGTHMQPQRERWSEKDALLITYGDMVQQADRPPLHALKDFIDERIGQALNSVHVLPFFPYSSDDGFSVIDYRAVDSKLGTWQDIEHLGSHHRLMADLVLNHVSSKSSWFRDYVAGIAPARNYFIEEDSEKDLSAVVRPRTSPLLTPTTTRNGPRHVWTTFSADQVDLDFANPDVLFEFIDILFQYISHSVQVIRLDAIAYLWKVPGTSCIHLEQTHRVVQLLRDVLELVAPHVILITETNVPHEENVSYFGGGKEAHMVYQFSLPPLVLHSLIEGNAEALTAWAGSLEPPPPGCTFLNFTASHDGIGVRPLEGLVPREQINSLAGYVHERQGRVSMKRNEDGTDSPYELNITYFDALGDAGPGSPSKLHLDRFLCSQTIPLALQGIPAVYFNSLIGARNNLKGMEETGAARTINRGKWKRQELDDLLRNRQGSHHRVLREYLRRIHIRTGHPSFHPDLPQRIHDLGPELFVVERNPGAGASRIICLHNVTSAAVQISMNQPVFESRQGVWKDLLAKKSVALEGPALTLPAYGCAWLTPDEKA